ncbi:MAG: GIY-YIG nuclease family protein [Desulfarculaceae bacterium]|nr:GIY-YIG nuclease family protein [Desulfarculaceae bacterium]
MSPSKQYWVYILTNKSHKVLYTGVTGDLRQRMEQHRGRSSSFTAKYKADKLVYAEPFGDIQEAIAREKQIKAGSRQKKLDLIRELNPYWKDLSEDLW